MSVFPVGWAVASLSELCERLVDGSHNPPQAVESGRPMLSARNINDFRVLFDDYRLISESAFKQENARTQVAPGDVLLTIVGTIGRTAVVSDRHPPFALQRSVAVLKPRGIDSRYLAYALNSPKQQKWLFDNAKGTAQKGVYLKTLGSAQIALAPAPEQSRIVAKLEELLSDLDAGVAELKAAQKKLAQYRQSLLKAAVEGALTAEWRARHQPADTGAQLLARILTERRARWEAKQLAKFKEQGKAPPKDWKATYPEPVSPDTTDVLDLPEGWTWATLSQVGWLDRGRSKHRPRNAAHLYGGPYPFVQTGDIRHSDTFVSSVEATYSEAGLAQSRLWPAGTMCITIAANIGKTAILLTEACFPDSVVGFLAASDEVSVRYIEYVMRSVQQKLEEEAPATAQKNINLEILERVLLPLPPFREQLKIVEAIESSFDGARDIEQWIARSLQRSTAQRQNILRTAFTGQLVPQDPKDEPASALLARIRAERAAREAVGKPRGRKAKEAA